MGARLKSWLYRFWNAIRELSGDSAYERYLAYHHACHTNVTPLSRKEFFRLRENEKWAGGIRRCC
jgi:uncharacterized short protein YbdD (DUF466 family)